MQSSNKVMEVKVEINEIENGQIIEKIKKVKSCLFENINKIDIPHIVIKEKQSH